MGLSRGNIIILERSLWWGWRRDREDKRKPGGLCNCPSESHLRPVTSHLAPASPPKVFDSSCWNGMKELVDVVVVKRSEWTQDILRKEKWQMQKVGEVPRGPSGHLVPIGLFQAGPPTELGDSIRADVQGTIRLNK